MEFILTKQKDIQNMIHYNYYQITIYKNHYEKTFDNGGYIKIPYPSQSNQPNIITSFFEDGYITKKLYIIKKIHSIENVEHDAELMVEHESITNPGKKLFSFLLLKTNKSLTEFSETKLDNLMNTNLPQANTFSLNEIFLSDSIKEAIVYKNQTSIEPTVIVIFTKPVLVNTVFDPSTLIIPPEISNLPKFQVDYSIMKIEPVLGNIIEGFKEGVDSENIVQTAAYCQPIDDTDPDIENVAQSIPIDSEKIINKASVATVNTVLNFVSFFITLLFAIFVVPIVYKVFILNMVFENESFTPQQKLNRVSGIDVYASLLFIGFSISLIHVGISNNMPFFTTVGMYLFIFYAGCLTYFQYIRIFDTEAKQKFLDEFVKDIDNEIPPTFEAVSNDVFGLIKDNIFLLLYDDLKKPEPKLEFGGILLVIFIFVIMYWILNAMHIDMSFGGGSFFLSLPLYMFLLAVYIAVIVKVQRLNSIYKQNKKSEPAAEPAAEQEEQEE